MASPVDAGRIATNQTTTADPGTANLPGSIAAGDTLILILRANNPTSITTPTGWTALRNSSVIGTEVDDDSLLIAWKKATGSEGSSVSVDFGAAAKFSAIAWRITGAADPTVTAPQLSTEAFSTGSTVPNPTTVTPTGGSKDYLFLWLGSWAGEQTSPPASGPSGYSNWTGANTGTAGATSTNNRIGGASKQATAASEDPPSVTISVSGSWTAYAMAIHPAASGPFTYTKAGYGKESG